MLFDTSSPRRKRVIRVVYAMLAFLFFVGFVGFGVGGNFSGGGILDALGITDSNGSSDGDQVVQSQIDDLQARFEKHPDNEGTVTTLLSLHLRQAQAKYTESKSIDDAQPDLDKALDVWERYLKTDPKEPSPTAAGYAVKAYATVGDYGGAAKAQQILVDANPKQLPLYSDLATLYYLDGNFKAGAQTAKDAVAQAPANQKAKVEKGFAKLAAQAKKQAKAQKAQEKAGGGESQALQDPFGSLGGSSGAPSSGITGTP